MEQFRHAWRVAIPLRALARPERLWQRVVEAELVDDEDVLQRALREVRESQPIRLPTTSESGGEIERQDAGPLRRACVR